MTASPATLIRPMALSARGPTPWALGIGLWAPGLTGSVVGLGLHLALRDAGLPAPAFLDNAANALVLPAAGLLIIARRPRLPVRTVNGRDAREIPLRAVSP